MDYGKIIHRKHDNSYVIIKNGMPYHVTSDIENLKEEWSKVFEYAKNNPEKVIEEIQSYSLLERLKIDKKNSIDSKTASDIYKGFTYKINGIEYHFNYSAEDQQNYADDANSILYQKSLGMASIHPIAKIAYSIPDNKAIYLSIEGDTFLDLYYNGALAHKNKVLKEGRDRKNKVEMAITKEELDAI